MPFDYAQLGAQWMENRAVAVVGRVACVPLEGAFQFGGASWMIEMFGGVSTPWLASLLGRIAQNPAIDAVVLEINSPGGSSFGVTDIAFGFNELRKAGKKVYAIAHDVACSLAMLPLCLSDEASATPTSILGAMGVRNSGPFIDTSAKDAIDGIKQFLPAFPDGKAQGTGAVPMSEEFMRTTQAATESVCRPFLEMISQRRGVEMSDLIALNAMLVTPAAAQTAGLIDRVEAFPAFLSRVLSLHNSEMHTMTPDSTPKSIATLAELKAAYPALVAEAELAGAKAPEPQATFAELKARFGSEPAFVVESLDKGLTLTAAIAEHSARVQASLEAKQTQVAELEARLASVAGGSGGANASAPGAGGTPAAPLTLEAAVQLCLVEAAGNKHKAAILANERWPQLAEALFADVRATGGVIR